MLRGQPELVAIGECGLDYHYDFSPRPAQREAFAAQVALANEYGLALVVHTREAWEDTFSVLASQGMPERTVFHCFTGGPLEAQPRPRDGGVAVFQRDNHVQERIGTSGPPPPCAPWNGSWWRRTRPSWRRCRTGASRTRPPWSHWSARRWPRCKGVDVAAVEEATWAAGGGRVPPAVTLSRPEVLRLLEDNHISPSRALGQNFVVDPNTVRRIARLSGVGPGDRVVEIGAGLGLADPGPGRDGGLGRRRGAGPVVGARAGPGPGGQGTGRAGDGGGS